MSVASLCVESEAWQIYSLSKLLALFDFLLACATVVPDLYSSSKKKRNTPIYFNTIYHTEMTLVPISMD